jgi:hypothetical protein
MANSPDCTDSDGCGNAQTIANSSTKPAPQSTPPAGTTPSGNAPAGTTPTSGATPGSAAPAQGQSAAGNNSSSSEKPPQCADDPNGAPEITSVEPKSIAIGENYTNVVIFGCNFKPNTKFAQARMVQFNGTDREGAKLVGDHEFVVPLHAADFSAPGNVAVLVVAHAAASGTAAGGASGSEGTSNVVNLTIKTASDVQVVWRVIWFRNRRITVELRLILLILFAGSFSAAIAGLKSYADYAGENKLEASWFPFYYAQPFVGAGLAFVFYLVIRGGFMAGTNADVKAVNPYGFVAVAALVGMFSDAAYRKLNDIADTIFKSNPDTRTGTLVGLSVDAPATLPAATHGADYNYEFQAKDGTPVYTWSSVNVPNPGGLTLETNGRLHGTPQAAVPGGVTFTVQVKDSTNKTATKEVKLPIN